MTIPRHPVPRPPVPRPPVLCSLVFIHLSHSTHLISNDRPHLAIQLLLILFPTIVPISPFLFFLYYFQRSRNVGNGLDHSAFLRSPSCVPLSPFNFFSSYFQRSSSSPFKFYSSYFQRSSHLTLHLLPVSFPTIIPPSSYPSNIFTSTKLGRLHNEQQNPPQNYPHLR